MELKAAASTTAPVIERSAQETQQQKKALESIVQWQDDWVAYEGKVYEYNENTINILLLGIDQSGRLKQFQLIQQQFCKHNNS